MPPKPDRSPKKLERSKSFRHAKRFLSGHGPRKAKQALEAMLAEVNEEDTCDYYGHGSTLNDFEKHIAEILGKEAAVFMPSGTMAQQIALRIWSEESGCPTSAFHPTCHLEIHCAETLHQTHGLERILVGERYRLITLEDLQDIAQPLAALLIELPQREIGGLLPSFEELEAQCAWARSKGIKTHMDGARLWESQPFYKRPHAEIAALFDSVYVSCYKGLGGLSGALLAGSKDFVERAKIWQQRLGGLLIHHYPAILIARAGLRERLPKFDAYHQKALALAKALSNIDGLILKPNPPQCHMMHVFLKGDRESLLDASAKVAKDHEFMLFAHLRGCDVPGYGYFELKIGDAAEHWEVEEVADLFRKVLAKVR